MRRARHGLLAALAFLLGNTHEAPAAQSATAIVDLIGVVLDQSAGGIPGVTITATNLDTQVSRMTVSDPVGRFVLPGLTVGAYQVTTGRTGFWPLTVQELRLNLGQRVELEIRLTPSSINEHVDVVSEASVALFERSPGSDVITQDRIDTLPTNGRHFVAFAVLAPGVSVDQTPQQGATRTSGLTFSGQRARSNNVMVDGLDNNDETVGSVRALFSQEAVREFQVISGSPPAEFGKASGGVINVVTRSGTDAISGNLFGFFRHQSLNSKGYFEQFAPSGEPIDRPKAPFEQVQFGGTLGGPVRRGSTFYFLSFERADLLPSNFVTIDDQTPVHHPLNSAVVLGTPAQILRNAGFPFDTGSVQYSLVLNQFLAKLDHHVGNHTIGARLNTATELHENVEPFGGQVARSRAAALESTDVMGAGFHTMVVSPRTLNDLRGQVALRDQIVRSLDPTCGDCLDEAVGGPTLEVTGIANVGRQRFTPTLRDNVRYQLADTLSHYRGAHQWRTGVDVSYIDGREQSLPLHFGGRYIFQNVNLPLVPGQLVPVTSIQAVALGLPVAYVQGFGYSGAASSFAELSVFVQDTWRLSPEATLNFGVRYQTQFWPVASYQPAGYPGTYGFPSDRNNVAPRVALTWRPGNSRTTSIQAGYGVYYDNTLTSVFGVTKYINGTDGLRTLAMPAPGSFAAWAAPGHRLSEEAATVLSGGRYASVAITIDPALTTPYAHHTTLGVERQLPGRVSLAAHLIHVRGFNQLGTIDYNPVVPSLGAGRRPADVGAIAGTSASVLQYTSFGETWYRGLRLSLEKRWTGGSQAIVGYTLSDAEDNSTDFQTAFLPQNNGRGRNQADPDGLPLDFRPQDERGPSVQDERHRLVASGAFMAPGGLQLAAIVLIGSGHPYNILAGVDLNGDRDGGSSSPDRPRRDPADPSTSIGRNAGRLPSRATVDIRLTRRFRVGSHVSVDPMLEVFNLFNRTNFTGTQNIFGPGAYPTDPLATFGQFTQAGAPRQVQLAVKVGF